MAACILAFDIGGSKLLTGLVAYDGHVLWSRKTLWSPQSAEEVLAALTASGREALAQASAHTVAAIGVNIPGIADYQTGTWVNASFSGISHFPVAKALRDVFGLPAYADNDAQNAALAERMFGAGRDTDDFLYLTLSNGIGGGIYAGGRMLRGASGGAGELGHCTAVENGRLCPCGKRGCLEAYAAGPGIALTYHELTGVSLNAEEIAAKARAGEAEALKVWELEGRYLGRAIAFAVNLLNPARVILGGGIAEAYSLFQSSLLSTLAENLFKRPNTALLLMPTPLGYHGALIGAAAVALQGEAAIQPCNTRKGEAL